MAFMASHGSSPLALRPTRPLAGADPNRFGTLLLALYRGIEGPDRWTGFLQGLSGVFDGRSVTLVLREPGAGDRGELFDVNTVRQFVDVYRSSGFEDDPFRGLPEGAARNILDCVSEQSLHASRFHRELLAPDGTTDILALNIGFAERYVGSLRISRRSSDRLFGTADKALLESLYPHLQTALEIHERARRRRMETRAYVRAMDQLAFGVVILNDRGDVVHVNQTSSRLIEKGEPLKVENGRLLAAPPATNALQDAIAAALAGVGPGGAHTSWLKLPRADAGPPLNMLLNPIIEIEGGEARPIGVALYVALDDRAPVVAFDACATLFGLSPAESALLSELVGGASILSASIVLGISEHTARTQLRSIFAKTGTHRQADLVRLILTSLAVIA